VAISDGTAVVAADHTDVPNAQGGFEQGQGQVFIYTSNGGNWSSAPVVTLAAPETTGGFGSAVAVSGGTVVVADTGSLPRPCPSTRREATAGLRHPRSP
jgi:hypothetical protein